MREIILEMLATKVSLNMDTLVVDGISMGEL